MDESHGQIFLRQQRSASPQGIMVLSATVFLLGIREIVCVYVSIIIEVLARLYTQLSMKKND